MVQTTERDSFFLSYLHIFHVSLDIKLCQGPSLIQSSASAVVPKEEQIISSLPSNEIFNLVIGSKQTSMNDLAIE
jgi:hypothetical protein